MLVDNEGAPDSGRRAWGDGPAWWAGVLAALAGLIVCLRLPWASDVLPGSWRWLSPRPPANPSGSVDALARNEHLGNGWPSDALNAATAVRDIWIVALAAGLVVVVTRSRWGLRSGARWRPLLRLLAGVLLVLVPLAAAAVAVQAIREVGVHALAALVVLPVPLVAGALVSAVWLLPRRAGGRWRPLAATMVFVVVVAAGTAPFARWYTGSRLISATATGRAAASDPQAPSRPGKVAWHLRSPNLEPVVRQRAGYTVITDYNDDVRGNRAGEVHVYDSATGRERWHYQRADAVLNVADLTADTLALQADDLTGHRSLIGIDLASGHRLWSEAPQFLWNPQRPPLAATGIPDSASLYTVGSVTPAGAASTIESRAVRSGGPFQVRVGFDCPFDDVLAWSTMLVVHQPCGSILDGYAANRPQWSIHLPANAYARLPNSPRVSMQLDQGVLAVPATSAGPDTADWIFYRASDGHELWREHSARELFLAGDRVVELTERSDLVVRDAGTGQMLWHRDPGSLHLEPGAIDNVVSSDGHLYAMWTPPGLTHVSLLTFDANSGAVTGTTDLTSVIGDPCPLDRNSAAAFALPEKHCAMQSLDAAGGGTVLITVTYRTGDGHFQDVVYAITDGSGFTAIP